MPRTVLSTLVGCQTVKAGVRREKKEIDRLTRRSQQITDFPLSGRRVPEYDMDQVREVIETPCRIIYRIKSDQIDVLVVIHEARNILTDGKESN
ncbi:MAG: type II toxin-antitoxin system RelE/ParE family toxin [Kiritimatiellota bacterium]|nr:type II toxin-antitoxin system RelE/ParE family toxin [Kiritimatiellota bacterium]